MRIRLKLAKKKCIILVFIVFVGVYVYDIIFLCVVNNLKKEECQDTHANTWTTDTQTLTDRIHQAVRKKNHNKGVVVVVVVCTDTHFFLCFWGYRRVKIF